MDGEETRNSIKNSSHERTHKVCSTFCNDEINAFDSCLQKGWDAGRHMGGRTGCTLRMRDGKTIFEIIKKFRCGCRFSCC